VKNKRTKSKEGARRARPAWIVLSFAITLGGVVALVLSFAADSFGWQWDLRRQQSWEGAKVNAQALAVDDTGVLLAPLGNRPISLLTPPLHLSCNFGRILIVRAECPDAAAGGVRASVRLLWQTEERPDFHFEEQIVHLGRKPTEIVFGLPARAIDLHRLGVQFTGVTQRLRTQGLEIPAFSPVQKLDYFIRQLGVAEPILTHSVNFVRGPALLGRSVNYFSVSVMIAAVGVYLLSRTVTARPIRWQTTGLILLVVWVATDVPATWRFVRQVAGDRAKFDGLDTTGMIAAAHGGEVAWAYEQLTLLSEIGATFAVVSDDSFAPTHRLAYLAAPLRTRREQALNADFIFICYASGAAYDANTGLLTISDQQPVQATEVARLSPDVYLLRNTKKTPPATRLDEPVSQKPVSLPWLILGIVVPWVTGMGLIAALGQRHSNIFATIGAGWLAGQTLIIAALAFALLVTGAGHARLLLASLVLLGIAFWSLAHRRKATSPTVELHAKRSSAPYRSSVWQTLGIVILLGIITTHVWQKGTSQWNVTARCDDAISIWLFKAKAIAVLNQLPTDPASDYYLGGSNPHYPVSCPLIAAWLPMVAGHWEERIATLPWFLCYINLLLLIGGGLRRRLTGTQATAVAYVVGSLPLVAMHVVRPGYADLMLAAFLIAGVLYLAVWRSTGRLRDLAMGGLFALTAACMKREGPPVVAIALAALVGGSWRQLLVYPRAIRWGLALAGAAGIALVVQVVGFSDHADNVAAFGYHTGVWSAVGRHLFEWDSFHALFWIVAALLPVLVWKLRVPHGGAAAVLILGWCGLITAIFVLTPQARFALNDQTPSRLFLQVAPSIVLVLAATFGKTVLSTTEVDHGSL